MSDNSKPSYVIIGSQAAISGSQAVISSSGRRPVIVTPVQPQPAIKKVLLKAVTKGKAKDTKMFTLRNLNPGSIVSSKDLMEVIRAQLSDDMIEDAFDVGFIKNTNTAVSIRSKQDLAEIWDQLQKGKNIVLWCDGMTLAKETKENRKRPVPVFSDDEDDDDLFEKKKKKRKKKREDSATADKVEEVIQKLKAKHGNTAYTQMQFRIWSEMIVGGLHQSQDDHPETTMFARCASGYAKKKSSNVVVKAIDKLSDALSPKQNSGSNQGHSPARVIENRSRCYRQLTELRNLQENGVLTLEEYMSEKEAVMASLKSLTT